MCFFHAGFLFTCDVGVVKATMKLLGSSIKGWEQLSERRHFTKQYLWHLKQAAPFLYVMSRRRWHGSINTNTSNNWFMNLQLMSNHSDLEVIDYHKVYSCWTCSCITPLIRETSPKTSHSRLKLSPHQCVWIHVRVKKGYPKTSLPFVAPKHIIS